MAQVTDRIDPIEALMAQLEHRPDAVAMELLPSRRTLTYRELVALAQRYKARFVREGVTSGEAVLLMLGSGPDLVASLYALMSLSALAVPVSPTLTDFELSPVLLDAEPALVVTRGANVVRPLLREALSVRTVLDVDQPLGEAELPLTAPSGDPTVTCHFTYKGVGYPLGALHRYSHYATCVHGIATRFGHTCQSTHLNVLPMHPVYGLTFSTMLPLSLGCRLLVVPQLGEIDILRVLREEQVQALGVVPLLYRGLLDRARAFLLEQKSLGLHPGLEIISGGNLLSRELSDEARELLGIDTRQGYGLTETLPVSVNYRERHGEGTLGPPLRDDLVLEVLTAQGKPVQPGRVGEIAVSGPSVSAGYLRRPKESARYLADGRCLTGDLGHYDRQGFLCFDGRSQPFTKPAAQMVDLTELERVLAMHPAVAQAVATVDWHPRSGERVSCSVIAQSGVSIDPNELKRHCAVYLSAHKLPRAVEVLRKENAAFARPSA